MRKLPDWAGVFDNRGNPIAVPEPKPEPEVQPDVVEEIDAEYEIDDEGNRWLTDWSAPMPPEDDNG